MNPALFQATPAQRKRLLKSEASARAAGQWGKWDRIHFPAGRAGRDGWVAEVSVCYRNEVFAVLERDAGDGVTHLAVASLSGVRPRWWEMQRIKNELSGPERTAVEVYPPQSEAVDEADMFHIWVLPGPLPFGIHEAAPAANTPGESAAPASGPPAAEEGQATA